MKEKLEEIEEFAKGMMFIYFIVDKSCMFVPQNMYYMRNIYGILII